MEIFILKRYVAVKWADCFKRTYLPSMLHFLFVGIPFYFARQNIDSSLLGLIALCFCSLALSSIGAYFLLASKSTKEKIKKMLFRK
jgi:hypothetical protein